MAALFNSQLPSLKTTTTTTKDESHQRTWHLAGRGALMLLRTKKKCFFRIVDVWRKERKFSVMEQWISPDLYYVAEDRNVHIYYTHTNGQLNALTFPDSKAADEFYCRMKDLIKGSRALGKTYTKYNNKTLTFLNRWSISKNEKDQIDRLMENTQSEGELERAKMDDATTQLIDENALLWAKWTHSTVVDSNQNILSLKTDESIWKSSNQNYLTNSKTSSPSSSSLAYNETQVNYYSQMSPFLSDQYFPSPLNDTDENVYNIPIKNKLGLKKSHSISKTQSDRSTKDKLKVSKNELLKRSTTTVGRSNNKINNNKKDNKKDKSQQDQLSIQLVDHDSSKVKHLSDHKRTMSVKGLAQHFSFRRNNNNCNLSQRPKLHYNDQNVAPKPQLKSKPDGDLFEEQSPPLNIVRRKWVSRHI